MRKLSSGKLAAAPIANPASHSRWHHHSLTVASPSYLACEARYDDESRGRLRWGSGGEGERIPRINSRIAPLNLVGTRSTASLTSGENRDAVERVPTIATRFMGRWGGGDPGYAALRRIGDGSSVLNQGG